MTISRVDHDARPIQARAADGAPVDDERGREAPSLWTGVPRTETVRITRRADRPLVLAELGAAVIKALNNRAPVTSTAKWSRCTPPANGASGRRVVDLKGAAGCGGPCARLCGLGRRRPPQLAPRWPESSATTEATCGRPTPGVITASQRSASQDARARLPANAMRQAVGPDVEAATGRGTGANTFVEWAHRCGQRLDVRPSHARRLYSAPAARSRAIGPSTSLWGPQLLRTSGAWAGGEGGERPQLKTPRWPGAPYASIGATTHSWWAWRWPTPGPGPAARVRRGGDSPGEPPPLRIGAASPRRRDRAEANS